MKDALLDDRHKKIIFVLHSQGGIEGSLVIDWLLAELPRDVLRKLEVYTFGNAANHFSNPRSSLRQERHAKVIPHIEHYANTGDFVAQWGVSNFIRLPNRYMGRLFERRATGHLLNQHYLDHMFPLNSESTACANSNAFMESGIEISDSSATYTLLQPSSSSESVDRAVLINMHSPIKSSKIGTDGQGDGRPKVKHFSRLWGYRNGMLPFDAPTIELEQDISAEKAALKTKMIRTRHKNRMSM